MKITKFLSKTIATVTIRITCSIALFCIIAFLVFCILFFKGLIPMNSVEAIYGVMLSTNLIT